MIFLIITVLCFLGLNSKTSRQKSAKAGWLIGWQPDKSGLIYQPGGSSPGYSLLGSGLFYISFVLSG